MKTSRLTKARRGALAMDIAGFDAFCASLPHAEFVVQWGDAHVWKVAGKVFAIARSSETGQFTVSFKCSALAFEILKDQPGLRPAPYLASRGFTWLQRTGPQTMNDAELCEHVRQSFTLVVGAMSKKQQAALAIDGVAHRDMARAGNDRRRANSKTTKDRT